MREVGWCVGWSQRPKHFTFFLLRGLMNIFQSNLKLLKATSTTLNVLIPLNTELKKFFLCRCQLSLYSLDVNINVCRLESLECNWRFSIKRLFVCWARASHWIWLRSVCLKRMLLKRDSHWKGQQTHSKEIFAVHNRRESVDIILGLLIIAETSLFADWRWSCTFLSVHD